MIKALSDINLDKSCRICLAEQNGNGEMYRLFPEEGKNNGKVTIPLCIKIMSCAAVQVGDLMPFHVFLFYFVF